MTQREISPRFTIEDIRAIREESCEQTKDMTNAEKIAFYNSQGQAVEREIARRRAQRLAASSTTCSNQGRAGKNCR